MTPDAATMELREVTLLGVGYDASGDIAVMVLCEVGGGRALPIWISGHEGAVIERVVARGRSGRPLTHEVLVDVVHGLGRQVVAAVVNGYDDGIFLAEMWFDDGTVVSARPSDMVRVALTVGVPMHITDAVLDRAAFPVEHPGDAGEAPLPVEVDTQAALFRAWLNTVRVEDF